MRLLSRFFLLLALIPATAQQLPVARLNTIFPPGAQLGIATEVKVDGADLDDADTLRFSHPGISAKLKSDGHFIVTATNVPVGIYDVRVIGRFGASNPRAFVIGDRPEIISTTTNKSLATRQQVPDGSTVKPQAIANAPEFFKFKAQKGQRIVIE